MRADLAVFLTLGPLVLGGVIALIADAFSARRLAGAVALVGLVVATASSAWSASTAPVGSAWGVLRTGGPFSSVAAVIAGAGVLSIVGGWELFARGRWGGTLAALVAFSAAGSIAVATSRDITMLLISLEITAVCAYALVAATGTRRSSEAAMKYVIQGAIATGFFLIGLAALVAAFIPSGDLNGLSAVFARSGLYSVAMTGIVALLAALVFKAGAAPFHSWAPDVYENAAPELTAFLATGPKVAALTALTIVLELVASDTTASTVSVHGTTAIALIVAVMAVASVTIGSLVALRQRSYTRMLAYAGIAQVGYALIGASTLINPATAVFFVSTYALATVGTFLAAAAFRQVDPGWDGSIAGLAGMGRKAPALCGALALLLMSLAGIPPLLGFWGKLVVFGGVLLQASTAFEAGLTMVGWMSAIAASVGIVGSIVSLGYYGAVLRALYLTPVATVESAHPVEIDADTTARGGAIAVVIVVLIAVAVVLLGVLPLLWGVTPLVAPFVPH